MKKKTITRDELYEIYAKHGFEDYRLKFRGDKYEVELYDDETMEMLDDNLKNDGGFMFFEGARVPGYCLTKEFPGYDMIIIVRAEGDNLR